MGNSNSNPNVSLNNEHYNYSDKNYNIYNNIDHLLHPRYESPTLTLNTDETSAVNLGGSPPQMGGSLKFVPTRKKMDTRVQVTNTALTNTALTNTEDLFMDMHNSEYQYGGGESELPSVSADDVMENLSFLMKGGVKSNDLLSYDISDLDTVKSDNVSKYRNVLLELKGGKGRNGGSDRYIDGVINNIIGGSVSTTGSDLDTLTSDDQMALRNIVMSKLNQQKGGVNFPEHENSFEQLYSSIGMDNIDKLKKMVLSEKKEAVHHGGYDEDSEDSEDEDEDKDDDNDNDNDNDNTSSSEKSSEKKNTTDDKKDDDDDDDEDDDDDDDDKNNDNDDDDDDDDDDEKNGDAKGGNSESFNSSDFRRLHAYMDSEAGFVAASNSNSEKSPKSPKSSKSSEDSEFKLGRTNLFTTDSMVNSYKGLDTASEYYNSLKNRATM
jgi:hypothetical protein